MTTERERAIHAFLTFIDGFVKLELIQPSSFEKVKRAFEEEIEANNKGWGDEELDQAGDDVLKAMLKYITLIGERATQEPK